MEVGNKKTGFISVAVLILLLIAYIPAVCWWNGIDLHVNNLPLIRGVIYSILFAAYGLTLRKRIIQTQALHFLIVIITLMVFWVLIRTIKYSFVVSPDIIRYLWYTYYIPMLMIPALFILVALSLGKPEQYRLPRWTLGILLVALGLALLVLTNDYHQLIFAFPSVPGPGDNYTYQTGYFVILGAEVVFALTGLTTLILRCRIPHSRRMRWLLIIPLGIAILYSVLYITDYPLVLLFVRDVTIFLCICFIAILESCIRCRLIQSNCNYDYLFRASTIGAQITDKDFRVLYTSDNAGSFDKQALAASTKQPYILSDGLRLSQAPIWGGHVFWQEDVSAFLEVLGELKSTQKELQSYGTLLQEENKQKERRKKLEEQKHLYYTLREKTAPQMVLLTKLAEKLEITADQDTARRLLGQIAVIGAYIKRRSNLVFLADRIDAAAAEELSLCLNESAGSLRLSGVTCASRLNVEGSMSLDAAAAIYDFYEAVVEFSLDTLTDLFASVDRENGGYRISVMLRCDSGLLTLLEQFPNADVKKENDVWYCALTVKAGDTK